MEMMGKKEKREHQERTEIEGLKENPALLETTVRKVSPAPTETTETMAKTGPKAKQEQPERREKEEKRVKKATKAIGAKARKESLEEIAKRHRLEWRFSIMTPLAVFTQHRLAQSLTFLSFLTARSHLFGQPVEATIRFLAAAMPKCVIQQTDSLQTQAKASSAVRTNCSAEQ